MKKFLFSLILVASTLPSLAVAQHRHHGPSGFHGHRVHHVHHRPHWHHGHGWMVPVLIGGSMVYMASRSVPVAIPQTTVLINEPTVALQSNQVIIDGIIYEKQMMVINGVAQEVLVKSSLQKTPE